MLLKFLRHCAIIQVFIKIARTGQAAFVDDGVERVTMAQIKPRKSKPEGSET